MPTLRLPFLLALSALLLAGAGCTTAKTRGAATRAVTELRTTAETRDTQYRDLVKGLIRQALDSRRDALRQRFEVERMRLVLQTHEKFTAEQARQTEAFRQQVRDQIKPIRERLDQAIGAENALLAAGGGSREKQQALALQLATTLALTQHRTDEELDRIAAKIDEQRSRILKTIRDYPTPPELSPDAATAEAEATALLADLDKAIEDYRGRLQDSEAALHGFIESTFPGRLAGQFFKGLLGPVAGPFVADKLQPKFVALETALTQRLDALKASTTP